MVLYIQKNSCINFCTVAKNDLSPISTYRIRGLDWTTSVENYQRPILDVLWKAEAAGSTSVIFAMLHGSPRDSSRRERSASAATTQSSCRGDPATMHLPSARYWEPGDRRSSEATGLLARPACLRFSPPWC
jgi:hypothetical protein